MAKKKKKPSLISNIAWRIFGALLIIFCITMLISSFSYHADDPSFNLATFKDPENLLGRFGAFLASISVGGFGGALCIFLIAPIIWGYVLLRGFEIFLPIYRVLALIIGTILLSTFLALISNYITPHEIGGIVGSFFAQKSMIFTNTIYNTPYTLLIVAPIFLILAFMAFNFTTGITYKSWYNVIKTAALAVAAFFSTIYNGIKYLFSKHPKKTVREKRGKTKGLAEPKTRKEPTLVEDKHKEKAEKKAMETTSKKAKEKAGDYEYPDVSLISKPIVKVSNTAISQKELDATARDLETVLQEFGVNGEIVRVRPGPVVTLYELEPAPGTKTARVIGLADDIARSMSVSSVRIAVVSGSNTIGIEMPNPKRETVWLRELFEDEKFQTTKNALNIVLGKNIGGENIYADLAKMPHLLVAGTTGSGKSVGVNQMILSLLFKMRPDECKFVMIDPKMLEFSMYNGIPHLLTPVITDPAKAVVGLKWAVKEMEDRYRSMADINVRNITGYNQKLKELKEKGEAIKRTVQTGFDAESGRPVFEEQELDLTPLPYIVIVVDEMADLMLVAGKEVEAAIQRLAQMARAAGIHLIMSTQRPSVDVITGTIKANFPTRISFQVTSKIDSRTILGEQGAEQLLGRGDMLYMPAGQRPLRIHGSFVDDPEIEHVVAFLKKQKAPEYISEVTAGDLNDKDQGPLFDKGAFGGGDDDIYSQAVAIVQNDKKASTSYLQRKLRIGYNKAASIIDKMEEEGIITKADHVGRREVI